MPLRRPLAFFFAAAAAIAQCDLVPTATTVGMPSLDRQATALCSWDPDGPGPIGERLVVVGRFRLAGDQPARSVAAFDPATGQWARLDAPQGVLLSVVALPGGQLLLGGDFQDPVGTGSVLQIWTGSSWSAAIPQPSGLAVLGLAVSPTGELFAACATGVSTNVQRFGSTGWQTIGTVATSVVGPSAAVPRVHAMAFDANGDLLVGGEFDSIEGVAAANLARWNGSTWAPIGSGVTGVVRDLLVTSSGTLFAGGLFFAGGSPQRTNIARWNGTSWQALGNGTQSTYIDVFAGVNALAETATGVVAAGQFDVAGGVPAFKVAQWNGTAWSAMGGGIEQLGPLGAPSSVFALQRTASGELFAAGNFTSIGGRDGIGLARWNGSNWTPLRAVGIGGATTALHRTPAGDVYLGGSFRDIDGVACNGIARRVGTGWQPLGSGIADPFGTGPVVSLIRSLPSGEVVVGGVFPSAGGVPAAGLAVWNGTSWGTLGSGLANTVGGFPAVQALHVAVNGELYVAGSFDLAGGVPVEGVARWDGSQWSAVAAGLGAASLSAVTTAPTGEVYVAGNFITGFFQTSQIVVVSGATSSTIATPDGPVMDFLVLPGGDLLVGGGFRSIGGQQVGCVARWSGGTWSPLGGLGLNSTFDAVRRLRVLPGGDLLAVGVFENGPGFVGFARWNGAAWTLLGDDILDLQDQPQDFAIDPSGEVLVAGSFSEVAGVASANLARLVAPCAATAVAAGNGCTGSGGLNQLATNGLPWLGEILVATASGMPNNALAVTVLGLGTANVPLPSLLPQGVAGCQLLVTPDVLGIAVPAAGAAVVPLPLPVVPSLVGGVLHLQVAPIEFGVGGAITAVTSTNRLSLTLRVF